MNGLKTMLGGFIAIMLGIISFGIFYKAVISVLLAIIPLILLIAGIFAIQDAVNLEIIFQKIANSIFSIYNYIFHKNSDTLKSQAKTNKHIKVTIKRGHKTHKDSKLVPFYKIYLSRKIKFGFVCVLIIFLIFIGVLISSDFRNEGGDSQLSLEKGSGLILLFGFASAVVNSAIDALSEINLESNKSN